MDEEEFDFGSIRKDKTPTPQPEPSAPTPTPEPTELPCSRCKNSFLRTELKKYRRKWYCQDCLEEKKAEETEKKKPPKLTPELIAELIPQLLPKLIPKLTAELKSIIPPSPTQPTQPVLNLDFDKVIAKINQLYEEFLKDGSHREWRHIFKRLYYNHPKKAWRPVGDPKRLHDADLWLRFFNTYWGDVTS